MTRPYREYGVMVLPATLGGCWLWIGPVGRSGYGRRGQGAGRWQLAHRWAYEHRVGPIPRGLVIDHACHDPLTCPGGDTCPHRRCVNPAHLRAVRQGDNAAADRTALGLPSRARWNR